MASEAGPADFYYLPGWLHWYFMSVRQWQPSLKSLLDDPPPADLLEFKAWCHAAREYLKFVTLKSAAKSGTACAVVMKMAGLHATALSEPELLTALMHDDVVLFTPRGAINRLVACMLFNVPKLTDKENTVLQAVGNDTLSGPDLAKRAGYNCNSNFRNFLSGLAKRGLLEKGDANTRYRVAPWLLASGALSPTSKTPTATQD